MRIATIGYLGLFFSLLSGVTVAQTVAVDSVEFNKINEVAGKVKAKYAPDKRTAWFEFSADNSRKGAYHIETTVPEAKNAFENALNAAGLAPTITYDILPNESVGKTSKGVVRLSVVDIRYTPANQAEMVTQALLGTPVDLLKRQRDYYLVRTPEGYIAWLKGSSLTALEDGPFENWQKSEKLMFTDDFGHAYTEANKQSLRVSDLVMGNIVALKGSHNDFYQVEYPDGREAFIDKAQAVPYASWLANTALTAENVLNAAKTMVGVPYLWGGTSVKGVDCSGLTKTAYYMSGLVIPRDASQQVNSGLNIDILTNDQVDKEKVLSNLKPADLIFFASSKGRVENPRVTHVAIYMGDGEFIHASGLVRINSLFDDADNYDGSYVRTIVSAKRYIGHTSTDGLSTLTEHEAYAVK